MTTRNPLVIIDGKIVELPAGDIIGGAVSAAAVDGVDGQNGGAITISYTFSTTTTDADPGDGKLRLDNATQNSATTIYVDLLDNLGSDWTSAIETFDDSTNTVKGCIRLVKSGDATKFLAFNVTALTTASGYRKLTVTNIASSASSPFSNGDTILLCFDRAGDAGGGAGAAGFVLVEQHTASASAQLDFAISSTYDTYVFELVNINAATSAASLLLRVGTGAGPTYDTGSNYNWASAISNSVPASAVAGSASTTSIELALSMNNGATTSLVGTVKLYDPANTTFHKRFTTQIVYVNSSSQLTQRIGGGSYATTTAVTAVRFFMSSGNIAAGTIRMYGLAK